MQFVLPGSPAKGEYCGPGWSEWILGFWCTLLAGTQIRAFQNVPPQQSALSYYFQEPGVRTFHLCAIFIDFAIVLTVGVWIFASRKAEVWSFLRAALCISGLVIGWAELFNAVKPLDSRVYVLEGLPFSPLNNAGLLGSAVFIGYFAMKVPTGVLSKFAAVLMKLLLWIGLFGVQLILFEQLTERLQ